MAIKHSTVASTPDDGTSEIGTNEWNDNHTIENNTVTDAMIASHTTSKITVPKLNVTGAPTGDFVGTSDTQTLTNKTISADSNTLSGIAASSFVVSDASGNIDGSASQKAIPSGVVVGTSDAQTLTNKTLTSPIISTISNTGTITLPSSTDTLVGKATTDTLTNKTVDLTNNTVTGTKAQFDTALSNDNFAYLGQANTFTQDQSISASVYTNAVKYNITTTTSALDFTANEVQTISISANTTFTGSNYATGASKTVKITTDATQRTLTFPSGWKFIGTKPANQAGSKVGILTLTCFGTAESDIVCAYAVEA